MTPINRRQFIGDSSKAMAGFAAAAALSAKTDRVLGANEKIVTGVIGPGGRGTGHARAMADLPDAEVGYLCDVDSNRLSNVAKHIAQSQDGRSPATFTDMRHMFDRDDLDAVFVATPDHWHALATILACQAGKDVYVEKPASYSIWEGRKMIEAARKYDRVVQVGTQNRSAPFVFAAIDYIKSGKLGDIHLVRVCNLKSGGPFNSVPDSTAPPHVNYDAWLGPAPKRPFNARRFHGGWYYYYDYCGGDMGNDASHQLDLFRMLMGDPPHPASVSCAGGKLRYGDERDVPDTQMCHFEYPDRKLIMTFELTQWPPYMSKIDGNVRDNDIFPHWPQCATRIELYGSKQHMIIGRHGGGWQVFVNDGKVEAQHFGRRPTPDHHANFLQCIRTRKRPNGDIEHGHMSAALSHMGNIAYRVGNRKLYFDGENERFVKDHADEANKLVKREPRAEYPIPEKV